MNKDIEVEEVFDMLFNGPKQDEIFEEGGLGDSFIFKKLNDSSAITTRVGQIIKGGTVVDKSYIEEQYSQIEKTRLSPVVEDVLTAYNNEEVILVFNKTQHLSTAVPFILTKLGGKIKAVIFISDFCSTNREGTALNIEMKKLYTLMEGALIALRYNSNAAGFQRSSTIAKMSALVYTEMAMRILNREFALSLEKEMFDMIEYVTGRFYLDKVFGLTSSEVIHSYAKGLCNNPDNTAMELAKTMYEDAEITSIESLISLWIKVNPKMERLTFRYFFERWVSSYGIGATLSVDNFPYLYYVMLSVLIGSFMINNTALNDVIKNAKGMANFHPEISRVV